MQKLLTFFFSKNISIDAIFSDQSFYDTLTNDIVSFEQLGPDMFPCSILVKLSAILTREVCFESYCLLSPFENIRQAKPF